jgi:hypothetical protein
MASLVLSGDTSGSITVSAPAVAGSTTQTLVNVTGTLAPIVSGTAVTASSTSVDFTGIPSWVKRITVMLAGVSTNGASNLLIQIGAGSIQNTGYISNTSYIVGSVSTQSSTAGFAVVNVNGTPSLFSGTMTLTLLNSSTGLWVSSHTMANSSTASTVVGGGDKTLSGTLDRVRITTVNGTDAFDAGSINLLWE